MQTQCRPWHQRVMWSWARGSPSLSLSLPIIKVRLDEMNRTASSSASCCDSIHLTHPQEQRCLFPKTSFYSPFLATNLEWKAVAPPACTP